MSLATNQQMTLLSVIGGSLFRMREDRMFSVVKMKELVNAAYLQVVQTMKEWPKTGNQDKNLIWISRKIDAWKIFLDTTTDYSRLVVLAYLCEQCTFDLQSQINSVYKQNQLMKLEKPLLTIRNFTDPDGVNFVACEKAAELLTVLYTLIEWEWKK